MRTMRQREEAVRGKQGAGGKKREHREGHVIRDRRHRVEDRQMEWKGDGDQDGVLSRELLTQMVTTGSSRSEAASSVPSSQRAATEARTQKDKMDLGGGT